MAHEFITYSISEIDKLFASVGVPGVILSIDTESEEKTCSVATDKWGIIEDVPFFYHCEDNSTARGYTAFKTESQDPALSQVMLLVKNGLNNDKKPNPAYDEIKVVGFYDGKLRRCDNYKIVFRTRAWTNAYSTNLCRDVAKSADVHWDLYSPYDLCFVYDLKTEAMDTEIKFRDNQGNYTIPIIYPIKYSELKNNTDLFTKPVYSSLPFALQHTPPLTSQYYISYFYLEQLADVLHCTHRGTTEELLEEMIENNYNLIRCEGEEHYGVAKVIYNINRSDRPADMFVSQISKACVVEALVIQNMEGTLYNPNGPDFIVQPELITAPAFEYARIIKPYDVTDPEMNNIDTLPLSEYPSNPLLVFDLKQMMIKYWQQFPAPVYPYNYLSLGIPTYIINYAA